MSKGESGVDRPSRLAGAVELEEGAADLVAHGHVALLMDDRAATAEEAATAVVGGGVVSVVESHFELCGVL